MSPDTPMLRVFFKEAGEWTTRLVTAHPVPTMTVIRRQEGPGFVIRDVGATYGVFCTGGHLDVNVAKKQDKVSLKKPFFKTFLHTWARGRA